MMAISFSDQEKQEIWTTVRSMNDAWIKGNPDDLAGFFHRNMVAITPFGRDLLDGAAACIAGWKRFADTARIHHWEETDPAIHVYGESAVVAYYYRIRFDMSGQAFDMEGRDMFFFIKEKGRWWAVADQFSSCPA